MNEIEKGHLLRSACGGSAGMHARAPPPRAGAPRAGEGMGEGAGSAI
eukprot:COSAG02_NODE_44324_length_367_cov_0.772388_1_plen_46_part_10